MLNQAFTMSEQWPEHRSSGMSLKRNRYVRYTSVESINQLINQSINLFINKSINQASNLSLNRYLIDQSISPMAVLRGNIEVI